MYNPYLFLWVGLEHCNLFFLSSICLQMFALWFQVAKRLLASFKFCYTCYALAALAVFFLK